MEYALLVTLIAAVVIGAVSFLGINVGTSFSGVTEAFDGATSPTPFEAKNGAGDVQFEIKDGKVVIGEVNAADGWTATTKEKKNGVAVVTFKKPGTTVKARGRIINGELKMNTWVKK